MSGHRITGAVAGLALLAACGGGTQQSSTGPDGRKVVGKLGDIEQPAKLDYKDASKHDPVHEKALLETGTKGYARFQLDSGALECGVRAQTVRVLPGDGPLLRWETGDKDGAASCLWPGGEKVELNASRTTIYPRESLFRVVLDLPKVIVQAYHGFVDVKPVTGAASYIVGPESQVEVATTPEPPRRAVADPGALPPTHRKDVDDLRASIPKLDIRLPTVPGSRGLERIRARGAVKVGLDNAGSTASQQFVRSLFGFLAEQWKLRLEVTPLTGATGAQRLRAGDVDLLVSPTTPPGLTSEPLFEDPDDRKWSTFSPAGDDGLRRALLDGLVPALNYGDYGRRYHAAFGKTPTYEVVRKLVLPEAVPAPRPPGSAATSLLPPQSTAPGTPNSTAAPGGGGTDTTLATSPSTTVPAATTPTPGAPRSSLSGVVNADGALVRGNGATAATRLGPGRYEVTFAQDVSRCAWTATIGHPGNELVYFPGLIYTSAGRNGPTRVYVEAKTFIGDLVDWPFHLAVSCSASAHFAVVDPNGALVRGNGATAATHLGVGRYEVTFNRDMNPCIYTATVTHRDDEPVDYPALVYTASGHSGPTRVYVETKNFGGGLADWPFHLAVSCPTAPLAGVVDANGALVRGSGATAATRLGPGRYEVTFNRDVSRCVYTATIGHPKNELVYYPGLVYTAGGHSGPTRVYVETKNMQSGLADWPFHLAVSC